MGIVLRQTRLSDTSLILTWLTRDEGKIKTVAKGMLRPKSPLAGQATLFGLCEFAVAMSRRSELHILRESRLLEAHEGLRTDYCALQMASYFCELIDAVLEPDHPEPGIFDLLGKALGYLCANAPGIAVVTRFELRMVQQLGIHDERRVPFEELAALHPRCVEWRKRLLAGLD